MHSTSSRPDVLPPLREDLHSLEDPAAPAARVEQAVPAGSPRHGRRRAIPSEDRIEPVTRVERTLPAEAPKHGRRAARPDNAPVGAASPTASTATASPGMTPARWLGVGAVGVGTLATAACGEQALSAQAKRRGRKAASTAAPAASAAATTAAAGTTSAAAAQPVAAAGSTGLGTEATTAPSPSATPAQSAPAQGMQTAQDATNVNQDNPVDTANAPDLSGGASQPESTSTAGKPAEADKVDAYAAKPDSPTVEAGAALAPKLTLRTTPEWHLARRAAQAPSAQIVEDIKSLGIEGWIDHQLDVNAVDDHVTEALIQSNFPRALKTSAEVVAEHSTPDYELSAEVMNSILFRVRTTQRVLFESVVELLGDHLYAPIHGKAEVFAGEHDQMLRKHALGTYEELLQAALTSPALLIELDNIASTKENPNENLGRELLELHSVGRSAYTEADVKGSTVILTGHGVDWDKRTYVYNPNQHQTGAVKVLGFSDANSDASKGPELIKRYASYLARHEKTAQRLARKFAVRFIADEPSDATVNDLAKVYLDSGTSLKALTKATLLHKEFTTSMGKKVRRPLEFVMTIARAAAPANITPAGRHGGGDVYNGGLYGWVISKAAHAPRSWPAVDGFPDTAGHWMSASLLLTLWNGAQEALMGDEKESGTTQWAKLLNIAGGEDALETARRITTHLTGYTWADEHLQEVAGALAVGLEKPYAAGQKVVSGELLEWYVKQAVRLTFASPYGLLR